MSSFKLDGSLGMFGFDKNNDSKEYAIVPLKTETINKAQMTAKIQKLEKAKNRVGEKKLRVGKKVNLV